MLERVIAALESADGLDGQALRSHVCTGLATPRFRQAALRLVDAWRTTSPGLPAQAVGAALSAAAFCEEARSSSCGRAHLRSRAVFDEPTKHCSNSLTELNTSLRS
jgi:hypothetical protein